MMPVSYRRNEGIDALMEKDKSTHYYALEGKAAKIDQKLKAPANFYAEKTCYGTKAKHLFLLGVLGIPILLGNAASYVIHKVKAEKIVDYEAKFKEWTANKQFLNAEGLHLNHDDTFKKFIDTCIENHIDVKECAHKVILLKEITDRANMLPYITERDGAYGGLFDDVSSRRTDKTVYSVIERKDETAFVLCDPRDSKGAQLLKKTYCQAAQVEEVNYAKTEVFRQFYRESYPGGTGRDVDRLAFAVFDAAMPITNERVAYLREEMHKRQAMKEG